MIEVELKFEIAPDARAMNSLFAGFLPGWRAAGACRIHRTVAAQALSARLPTRKIPGRAFFRSVSLKRYM